MAMNGDQPDAPQSQRNGRLLVLLIALGGALAMLCHQGFLPHHVFWANDVPLGAMLDPGNRLPGTFAGHWGTLEYIGGSGPSSSPSITTLLQMILPPEIYLKIYAPLTMLFLGIGAWLFFRQLGFAPPVCVVGGLGAGLNMHFFSNACWGLGQWNLSAAMVFVSLAALVSPSIRPLWVKAALVGLALGMVVMDGFDVGAIFSLYVGMFIVFYFLSAAPNPAVAIPKTIGMGAVAVLFALLISSSTINTLVGTQIKGTASRGQNAAEQRKHWVFLTQWSFPKLETLRLVIPGLFGYRLQDYMTDTNKASAYWGRIGEDLRVDELESSNPETRARAMAEIGVPPEHQPELQNILTGKDLSAREQLMDRIKGQMQRRHTGSGDYTGVLVCLLAFFGLFNSWRKRNSPYSKNERQAVWFWGVAALISLMAAWGRFSFVYQFIARLPFINNIRNAIKFLHPLNICLIILSGYGLETLHRRYMRGAANRAGSPPQQVVRWWGKLAGFDRKWIIGTLLVLGASVVGLLFLSSSEGGLAHYLEHNGFSDDLAPQIAAFCVKEVVWFIVFFAASAGVLIVILSGAWSGNRAIWGWLLLGAIMIFDLSRADAPWVRYYDYKQKYSMNPVVDFLRHDPWEHRVMSRFSPTGGYIPGDPNIGGLCHWWLENDYLANNIESLEIDQAPRLPELDANYIGTFAGWSQQDLSSPVRLWRLTNTRYILADARITPALNQLAEPKNSFRNIMLMDMVYKPGVTHPEDAGDWTVVTNDNGHVALIEFTQALPRAKLYSNWQMADDQTTLGKLNSVEFDPAKTVLVATNTPVAQTPAQPQADPGTVKITTYLPRYVKLEADAKIPAIMLLNDRTGEYWKVWVDQKPATMLRCNYIMRGVFLPPGQHTIEFRFRVPMQWLYVSVTAFAFGILLAGYVIVTRLGRAPEPNPASEKTPAKQNRQTA
jgi:hypothetical protein